MAREQVARPLEATAEAELAGPQEAAVQQVERLISRVLQAGVWGSATLIVVGSALAALRRGGAAVELGALVGASGAFPRSWAWLAADLAAGGGTALIVIGLLLLISTPVLRVAISIVTFARLRDRAFMLITAGVLALLAVSFLLGGAG